jgi:chorismate--pyruvate lyase
MKKLQRDPFWNGTTICCDAALIPWLHDHGSLTKRIQQRCDQFSVNPVRSGLARIAYNESALLGIAPQQLAYSREVFLYANGKPVVFAHSTCAVRHLRGVWSSITGLGSKSLGTMLFTHPMVVRKPLHFKTLRPQHPLYRSTAALQKLPSILWARRSLFYLHDAPLLVTEVFLPEILKLNAEPHGTGYR